MTLPVRSTKMNFDVFKSLNGGTRKFLRLIAKSYPFCGNFTLLSITLDVFRIFSSREVHLIESFSYEPPYLARHATRTTCAHVYTRYAGILHNILIR